MLHWAAPGPSRAGSRLHTRPLSSQQLLGSSSVVPREGKTRREPGAWSSPGKSESSARCSVLFCVPWLSCMVELTFTLCSCESCQPLAPQCAKAHKDPAISNPPLSFPPFLPSFPSLSFCRLCLSLLAPHGLPPPQRGLACF